MRLLRASSSTPPPIHPRRLLQTLRRHYESSPQMSVAVYHNFDITNRVAREPSSQRYYVEMAGSFLIEHGSQNATRPRITSSLVVPVPNVALWAPAAAAILYSIICPFSPTKLFPKLPLVTSNVFLSSSPVYPLPVEQVVVTPKHAANTKSLAFEVVSPLIVATPFEAGVVLY